MALDGSFLAHVKKELEARLLGARVDRIYQPNREEVTVAFRNRDGAARVLFSCRANSARVHLTEESIENPKQPPMLCMLLRKKLLGARLTAIRQPGLERVLQFDLDAVNDLGDRVPLCLCMEIMGKYSNLILVDENGVIIDALKRVDEEMSSRRLVQPGLLYELPPPQEKKSLLELSGKELCEELEKLPRDMELSKGILACVQGLSPIVCREIAHRAGRGRDLTAKSLDEEQQFRVGFFFQQVKDAVIALEGAPWMAVSPQGKPLDFSFVEPRQYGSAAIVRRAPGFSALLDDFYRERDRQERMRVRQLDLLRLLATHSERLTRKIAAQQAELETCAKREELRVAGDLLSANLYAIEKGASLVQLPDYYQDGQPLVSIRLDPALSPSQNAQKYYREYRKAKTAEEKLLEQIALAQGDLEYLDSVLDALSRAETQRELQEIRAELSEQGYIRVLRSKQPARRQPAAAALGEPLRYRVRDGFTVLVGRNNRQNDRLTLKTARGSDLWFHVKNSPGAHVVLLTRGQEPTRQAMEDAAVLAAAHSRAAQASSRVPVDMARVRHVSKPQGAKPGMVIYTDYQTIFADPAQAAGIPREEDAP